MVLIWLPCASNKLDDRSKEKESTVESEPHGLPLRSQKPIKNLEPLPNQTQQQQRRRFILENEEEEEGFNGGGT